eukprot:bmy_19326T0
METLDLKAAANRERNKGTETVTVMYCLTSHLEIATFLTCEELALPKLLYYHCDREAAESSHCGLRGPEENPSPSSLLHLLGLLLSASTRVQRDWYKHYFAITFFMEKWSWRGFETSLD